MVFFIKTYIYLNAIYSYHGIDQPVPPSYKHPPHELGNQLPLLITSSKLPTRNLLTKSLMLLKILSKVLPRLQQKI